MSSRRGRILRGAGLLLAALALGFGIAVWVILSRTLPPTDGVMAVEGLDRPVEITFDSMGVAQIWAETEHDALFGFGWLHAADRMFQMDFARRVAQGRLSELLGETTVEFDKDRRRDGHSRLAKKALAGLRPENRDRLQAYAEGVNAFRQQGEEPLEYILLQARFEEWQVYDCLTVLSFMTWYSDALQNRDEYYATLVREGRQATLESLPLGYPAWAPTTVRGSRAQGTEEANGRMGRFAETMAQSILAAGVETFSPARSSNAWAVAPDRSLSGRAMFCSDPHLELTRLPQFWYAVGLHVRDPKLDVVGVSIPGLPFIVMGHNGGAAWGFTAGGVDLVDYYIERVNPNDSAEYLAQIDPALGDDSALWEPVEFIYDTIAVAKVECGVPFVVRLTRHGPVEPEWSDGETLYTRRWAGQDADLDAAVAAGWRLMQPRDFAGFRAAVTAMGALNANWMYADAGGTIGYQLGSPVPRRDGASPYVPLEGWSPESDWDGYLEPGELPSAMNPPQGWLANCNNKPEDRSEIPGSYAIDRILRIEGLLQSKEQFSTEDMKRFQADQVDEYRLRWKGLVDSVGASLSETTGGVAAVASWDGAADTASQAVGLIVTFLNELRREVFEDELGALADGVGSSVLDQVFFGGESGWIDDRSTPERVESRYEVAERALGKALETTAGRRWGEMQTLRMAHPMARAPIVGSLIDLSFGPWPRGGTSGTLNSSFHQPVGPADYETTAGPSWRFVLDFADVDGAEMVLPAGNSGNPLSSHFFDFNEMWRTGGYWNVPIGREAVFRRAVSVLRLVPSEGSIEAGE